MADDTGFYRVRAEKGPSTGTISDIEVTVAGGPVVGLVLPLPDHDEGTPGLEAPVVAPTVAGSPFVGSTLSVNAEWAAVPGEPAPVGILGVQWTRDGMPIPGATSATYTATDADAGHLIAATVIAGHGTLGGFECDTIVLAASAIVVSGTMAATGIAVGTTVAVALALVVAGGLARVAGRGRDARPA